MSKRIKTDSDAFLKFIENYRINISTENEIRINDCRSVHKKVYAIMTFINESASLANNNNIFIEYLLECMSDLLQCIFLWTQGLYKAAKLQLRCSIENYLKAILCIADPNIINVRLVYAIFDQANIDSHFSSPTGRSNITKLKNSYSLLSEVVHGKRQILSPITALSYFPKYDDKDSKEFIRLYTEVTRVFLNILFLNYYEEIHNMHPENKQDFMDALSAIDKKNIVAELFP